jgi:hypothetical protein
MTSIGENAFFGCYFLTVYAPHEASYYGSSIGDYKKWVVQ